MSDSYTVYAHLNKINGKAYVGITSKTPNRRWGHNGEGYKTQTHFWRAIQKYGWDSFEHVIIASGVREDEACSFEVVLIGLLKTNNPKYGYNYEAGGRCHTYESRKKIGDSERGSNHHFYGKHRSEETRKKISEALSGEKHPCYNKHLSEKTRKRISESEKGVQKPKNNPKLSKPVLCVETNVVYPSMKEVTRQLNIHRTGISMVLNGKRETAGGYHWKYAKDSVV